MTTLEKIVGGRYYWKWSRFVLIMENQWQYAETCCRDDAKIVHAFPLRGAVVGGWKFANCCQLAPQIKRDVKIFFQLHHHSHHNCPNHHRQSFPQEIPQTEVAWIF